MLLQTLFEEQEKLLDKISLKKKRYLYHQIDLNLKSIAILGQRGVGKTTTMLQLIKENFKHGEALYISLDHPIIQSQSLYEMAKEFEQYGIKHLFLDEVHKYNNWASHIKSIYDMLELKVVISGSSILQISKQKSDLSRRTIVYHLENISFREYLEILDIATFKSYTLEGILQNHTAISSEISREIKPLLHFKEYLKYGAYPFILEDKTTYHKKIVQIINLILETDLPYFSSVDAITVQKLKKLIYLLAVSVPFIPNITDIAQSTEISRPKVYDYLELLQRAKIINSIRSKEKGYKTLVKPEKLFMQNSNISYAITSQINIGSAREAFFVNQIKNYYDNKERFLDESIYTVHKGDFLVDDKYIFEVGGKNKSFKQIKDLPNSYVVADDVEIGFGNKIPLWLFGFLY